MKTLKERVTEDGFEGFEPVLFYSSGDEWGMFSNFSRHPVVLPHPWSGQPVRYATSEHRYQALKATKESDHDWVAGLLDNDIISPSESKDRGGPKGIRLRTDWGDNYHDLCYYVMLEVIMAKVLQHPVMGELLSDTGGRPIYEDSPTDAIWGVRFNYKRDYSGKNLLGRALMETRSLFFS